MEKNFIRVSLADLIPYEGNARKNDATVPDLQKDMEQVGYISPIVVDENMQILAGHTRLKALKNMGVKTEQVVIVTGLTEDQKKMFRLYDNKIGEKSEWDFAKLADEIEDLDFGELDIDWHFPDLHESEPKYYGHTRERSFKQSNFDQYDSERVVGKYDMPVNYPVDHIPTGLVGFDKFLTSKEYEKGVHFYLYDYMFERLWSQPKEYLPKLARFDCVISPDFSLYTDMPIAQQVWNTYRNRLLTQMMQDYGITVIPTIMWSTPESYEFCFDGLPMHSTLAVETVGCINDVQARGHWFQGMSEALERLEPTRLILYGVDIGYDFGNLEVVRMTNTNDDRIRKSRQKRKVQE